MKGKEEIASDTSCHRAGDPSDLSRFASQPSGRSSLTQEWTRLTRQETSYLRKLSKQREGWMWVDRSHWNSQVFQALLKRNLVRYTKPSLRARCVGITTQGRAALGEEDRTCA